MAKVESRGLTKAQMKEKIRERYKGVSLDEAEVIPARKQRDFYDTDEHQRVAVYVRVSTDNIQQTSSYELQKNYYEDMVNRHDTVDLDFYREARKEFNIHEWIDVVLTAVDYNPEGYVDENGNISERKKLCFLRRLLPFVEKRVNLIELAPKGTGKSYVFEKISKRGWLISGGTVSRASLIYDNSKKTGGLLTRFDYVGFDEVQSITFEQPGQIQQALKHYMEFGEIKGFDAALTAEAGVIVLGNINAERFDINKNMVEHISEVFGESATLDRFHGFIPGWEIPRMTTGLIAKGWAINTEYFAEVLHELRSDLSYAAIVEEMISYKPNADKRDLTAIKRLCTAFMKLLFPHVQSRDDISQEDFENYCLKPAMEMRSVIKKQLCIIDPREFDVPGKRTIPEIVYKP